MQTPLNLAILLFADVELLDFCGPFEVFSTANRQLQTPAFNAYLVAESELPVRTHNGVCVVPQFRLSDCPEAEIILIPGGIGTRNEIDNVRVIDWIRSRTAAADLVLSVCTGALLLGKAGVLAGLNVTTHRAGFERLSELEPTASIQSDCRYVDNGKVITSAGIAAGIDMSLHVVRRLFGMETAVATARHMEYPLNLPA